MHTVHLLEQALEVAEQLGFKLRQEWLGGQGGGVCHMKGDKWLFVDLTASAREQLHSVVAAIRSDPLAATVRLPPGLDWLLPTRKAA